MPGFEEAAARRRLEDQMAEHFVTRLIAREPDEPDASPRTRYDSDLVAS